VSAQTHFTGKARLIGTLSYFVRFRGLHGNHRVEQFVSKFLSMPVVGLAQLTENQHPLQSSVRSPNRRPQNAGGPN